MTKEKIMSKNEIKFIRELCSHLSEEEIREAEETFREYVEIVWRIFERTEAEQKLKDKSDPLTVQKPSANINGIEAHLDNPQPPNST